MFYSKPELIVLDTPLRVIEGGLPKAVYTYPETRNQNEWDATIGAYEADE